MKHAKRLFCAVLALMLALSLAAMPAFADETTTKVTKLTISETLTLPSDIPAAYVSSVPKFHINVTLAADATVTNGSDAVTTQGNSVGGNTKQYQGVVPTDTSWNDKKFDYSSGGKFSSLNADNVVFDLSGLDFSENGAGVYKYNMTTTPVSDAKNDAKSLAFLDGNGEALTYPVEVYVVRDSSGSLYISQVIVYTDTTVSPISKLATIGNDSTALGLSEELDYVKVTIDNEVVGSNSDPADIFNYQINIPGPGTGIDLAENTEISGYKQLKGETSTTDVSVTVGEGYENFSIKQGDKIVLYVPNTMIFYVDQIDDEVTTSSIDQQANTAPTGYSTTHEYTTESEYNGAKIYPLVACDITTDTADDSGNYKEHDGLIYDTMDNQVHFINTRNMPAVTGVTMDVLPYVMVVLAVAAAAVLTIAKKRKTDW